MLIDQIIEELKAIPEERLEEIYDLIHYLRLGLREETQEHRTSVLLKGKFSDSFFAPLPEDELKKWE